MQVLSKVKELDDLVDVIFNVGLEQGLNNASLADKAGLTHETVRRLGTRETMDPRMQTGWRLARAVGLTLAVERLRVRRAG